MPDNPTPDSPTSSNGAAPSPSLRDIAEDAYDQVLDEADESPDEPDAGQSQQPRDNRGRFASKEQGEEPGEAEAKPPSPDEKVSETQTQQPDPAAQARSSQEAPQHWSAEDRALFEKLPPDGKAFLQRRFSEMEADYTRKSQANAGAVNFANALVPVFNDREIAGSLQGAGLNPVQAIHQWADFHRRAISQNPQVRYDLLVDLAQRCGFDPARMFAGAGNQPSPAGQLSEADLKDPAIRFFADNLGQIVSSQQALRSELDRIRQAETQRVQDETLRVTRWGIDSFADEKDAQGNPRYPHFDKVLPEIITLYRADPNLDLRVAYNKAIRMNDEVYQLLLQEERSKVQNGASVDRAKAAMRGNTRGMTAPVSKPNAPTGNGSLRDLLEASAEEIGF